MIKNRLKKKLKPWIQRNSIEAFRLYDRDIPEYPFINPPTFSNSKKMEDLFEIEKDQIFLVESCMKTLAPNGIRHFSNNKRKFKLSEEIRAK